MILWMQLSSFNFGLTTLFVRSNPAIQHCPQDGRSSVATHAAYQHSLPRSQFRCCQMIRRTYYRETSMTTLEVFSILTAAMAAGAINAVAGGGTILTFPTLLAFGTPAIIANATSTVALVFGTSGSVYGFRKHIPSIRLWLGRFIPISLLGGLVGSWLLTITSNAVFSRLVPYLIFFATLLFLVQGFVAGIVRHRSHGAPKAHPIWPAIVFQFFVALYGGFFGAGIGILMLASLGFIGLTDIHQMNALKNILGSLINVVAAIMFISRGIVDWPKVGVMTIGAITGYFLGSHFSQKIPQLWVRRIVLIVGFSISAITFFEQMH